MERQAGSAQHSLETAHQVMMADQAKLAAFPKSDSDFVTNHAEARPWQTEGRIPTGPNSGSGGQDAFRRPSAFELRFTLKPGRQELSAHNLREDAPSLFPQIVIHVARRLHQQDFLGDLDRLGDGDGANNLLDLRNIVGSDT